MHGRWSIDVVCMEHYVRSTRAFRIVGADPHHPAGTSLPRISWFVHSADIIYFIYNSFPRRPYGTSELACVHAVVLVPGTGSFFLKNFLIGRKIGLHVRSRMCPILRPINFFKIKFFRARFFAQVLANRTARCQRLILGLGDHY